MLFRNLTNNIYAGTPNAQIDAAWSALMAPMHIRVTADELAHDGQESVVLPENGGYLGWLGAFHELHCVVSKIHPPSFFFLFFLNGKKKTCLEVPKNVGQGAREEV